MSGSVNRAMRSEINKYIYIYLFIYIYMYILVSLLITRFMNLLVLYNVVVTVHSMLVVENILD